MSKKLCAALLLGLIMAELAAPLSFSLSQDKGFSFILVRRLVPDGMAPGVWPGLFAFDSYYVAYNNFTWQVRIISDPSMQPSYAVAYLTAFFFNVSGRPRVVLKRLDLDRLTEHMVVINDSWIPTFMLNFQLNPPPSLLTKGSNFIALLTAGALVIASPRLDKVVVIRRILNRAVAPYPPPSENMSAFAYASGRSRDRLYFPSMGVAAAGSLLAVFWSNCTAVGTIPGTYATNYAWNISFFILNVTSILASVRGGVVEVNVTQGQLVDITAVSSRSALVRLVQGRDFLVLQVYGSETGHHTFLLHANGALRNVTNVFVTSRCGISRAGVVIGDRLIRGDGRVEEINWGLVDIRLERWLFEERYGLGTDGVLDVRFKLWWYSGTGWSKAFIDVLGSNGTKLVELYLKEYYIAYPYYVYVEADNGLAVVANMHYQAIWGGGGFYRTDLFLVAYTSTSARAIEIQWRIMEEALKGREKFPVATRVYGGGFCLGPLCGGAGDSVDIYTPLITKIHVKYPFFAIGGLVFMFGTTDPEGVRELRVEGSVSWTPSVVAPSQPLPFILDRSPDKLPNVFAVNVTVAVRSARFLRGFTPVVVPNVERVAYADKFETKYDVRVGGIVIARPTVGEGTGKWTLSTLSELYDKPGMSGVQGSFTLDAKWIGSTPVGGTMIPVASAALIFFTTKETPITSALSVEYQIEAAAPVAERAGSILIGDALRLAGSFITALSMKTVLVYAVRRATADVETIGGVSVSLREKIRAAVEALKDRLHDVFGAEGVEEVEEAVEILEWGMFFLVSRDAEIKVSGLNSLVKQLVQAGVPAPDAESVVTEAVQRAFSVYFDSSDAVLTPDQVAATFATAVSNLRYTLSQKTNVNVKLISGDTVLAGDMVNLLSSLGDPYTYSREQLTGMVKAEHLEPVFVGLLLPAAERYVRGGGRWLASKYGERLAASIVAQTLARAALATLSETWLGFSERLLNIEPTYPQHLKSSLRQVLAAKGYNPNIADRVSTSQVSVTIMPSPELRREVKLETDSIGNTILSIAGSLAPWALLSLSSPAAVLFSGAFIVTYGALTTALRIFTLFSVGALGKEFGAQTVVAPVALVKSGSKVTAVVSNFMSGEDVTLRTVPYRLSLSEWLREPLTDFVKRAAGVDSVIFVMDLGEMGKYGDTLLLLGVLVVPVAWGPPPLLGESFSMVFSGGFRVVVRASNFQMEDRELSDGEIVQLLRELTMMATLPSANVYREPVISGRTARFTLVEQNATYIGATAFSLIFGERWRNVAAALEVNSTVWILDKLKVLGDEPSRKFALYSNITYPSYLPPLHVKGVRFTRVPPSPVRALISSMLPDGYYFEIEVPRNLMQNYTLDGITYTYIVPLTILQARGIIMKAGDNWIYALDYAGLNLKDLLKGKDTAPVAVKPANDTAVKATFDSDVLPSRLIVGVFSPMTQHVKLDASYRLERLEKGSWVTVEAGTVASETFMAQGMEVTVRSYDVRHLTARALKIAEETNAAIRVRVTVGTERPDLNPGNNWAEVAAVVTPEQRQRAVGPGNYANLTVLVYDAITTSLITGANVTVEGALRESKLTGSNGEAIFLNLPVGLYRLTVSKTGYNTFMMDKYIYGNYKVNVALVPTSATQQPPSGNASQPPVVINGTTYMPLEIVVVDQQWAPVAGASVTVNNVPVGQTDATGSLLLYYPQGSSLRVTVSYREWSETRSLVLNQPTLLVFRYTGSIGLVADEVAVVDVFPMNDRVVAPGRVGIMAFIFSSVKQTITVRLGIAVNGTVVASAAVQTTAYAGTTPIYAVVDVPAPGDYVTFANITVWEKDTNRTNNLVYGARLKGVRLIKMWPIVELHVADPAGYPVIYPGKTLFEVRAGLLTDAPVPAATLGSGRRVKVFMLAWMPLKGNFTVIEREAIVRELAAGRNILLRFNTTCPFAGRVYLLFYPPNMSDVALMELQEQVSTTLEVPPHYIVLKVDMPRIVQSKQKFAVKVNAWTNVPPPQYVWAYINFSRTIVETPKYMTVVGEHTVEIAAEAPGITDIFSFVKPVEVYDGRLLVWALVDSYLQDNYYTFELSVVNTSSWLFWLLVVIGVLLVILALVVVIKLVRGATSAVVVLRSPYLEW